MGRKRIYKSAAEKQRAWRLRHGQPSKVSTDIRIGEKLGTSEAYLRAKNSNETWEEYHRYIQTRVGKARVFKSEQVPIETKEGDSIGAKRVVGKYVEPSMDEEYHEIRRRYEADLEKLVKKGNKIKQRRD